MSDMLELIKGRRSIRHFTGEAVGDGVIDAVLEAGAWAPSGLNNQPWAFAVIRDEAKKQAMSRMTHYGRIILDAPVLIAVFLDNEKTYDRTKDCQAIGACIQNMLMYVHSIGLGAVWLGEILKSRHEVGDLIGAPDTHELMAVVALGHPEGREAKGKRRPTAESVIYRD